MGRQTSFFKKMFIQMHTGVLIADFLKYNRKDEIYQHSGGMLCANGLASKLHLLLCCLLVTD